MKECTYCGKDFTDASTSCDTDGHPLRPLVNPVAGKGIWWWIPPELFEKEKGNVLQKSASGIASDDESFTEALAGRKMREIFDAYDIERNKLRQSFCYKFYKGAKNFSMSVNKCISNTSKTGELVSRPELIRNIAQEYRKSSFEVLEQQNQIEVCLNKKEVISPPMERMELVGVIVFVTQEKSWQIMGRFDADVYRSQLETIGRPLALFTSLVIGILAYATRRCWLLILALLAALFDALACFRPIPAWQLTGAQKYAQKPLNKVLEDYIVSDT